MSLTIENANALTTKEPEKRSQRFLPKSRAEILWSIFIAVCIFTVTKLFDGLPAQLGTILAAVAWYIGMRQPEKHDDRVFMVPFNKFKRRQLRRADGILLDARTPWERDGREPTNKELKRIEQVEAAAAKGKARKHRTLTPLEIHGFGDLGLAFHTRKLTHSLVFTTTGSPTLARRLQEQFADHRALGMTLCKGASVQGASIGVGIGIRTRPENVNTHWLFMNEFGESRVVDYQETDKPESEMTDAEKRFKFLHGEFNSLKEIYDRGNGIDMVLVITVSQSNAFRKALEKEEMTQHDVDMQPISRIRTIIDANLREQGWAQVHALTPSELEKYLRRSWDAVGLGDYNYRSLVQAATGETTTDNWYPEKLVQAKFNYVVIDGNYCATLKVTHGRRSPLPHEPRQLYASSVPWFSAGIVGETISAGWEYRSRNLGRSVLADAIDVFGLERTGPAAERVEQESYAWLKDMDEARFTMSYNKLIGIIANSLEELAVLVQAETDRQLSKGNVVMRVEGEERQYVSFMTAATLIDLD